MGTKKTTKKAAKKATKKAAKKTATKAATKKIIRGGSARLNARDTEAGLPPSGAINAGAVDNAVAAWTKKPVKSKSDYLNYRIKPLIEDAGEMRGGVQDLALFKAIAAPVGERDFVWLGLLHDALVLIGDDADLTRATRKTLSREAEVAVAAVRSARTQLARVGIAGGVSARLLSIPGGGDDPASILGGADKVVRQAQRTIATFHDRKVAATLIANLEKAANQLRDVVFGKESAQVDDAATNARRAALKRITYDVLTHIGPWGLAAVGDDPTKEARYRLDKLFPSPTKKTTTTPPAT